MGKAFLGFLAGIALTSLAFVLLDQEPPTRSAGQSTTAPPLARSTPEPIRDIAPVNGAQDPAGEMPAARLSPASADGAGLPEELKRLVRNNPTRVELRELLSGWTDEELEALRERAEQLMVPLPQTQEAEGVRNLVSSELRDRELLARWVDAGPPDLPIQLPPEFSYLSEMVDHNHEYLQRDSIDPDWSRQMEAQIQDFFTSRPEITATYGYPTINCRTVACEIAFVAYGVDNSEIPAAREWSTYMAFWGATDEIFEQPWSGQLNRTSGFPEPRFQEGGAVTFLWHISRAGARH